ncbi:MAG: ABC-2 family transporter protein [Patescibacteria group bacterium]|nr:ABC-2 family transporter protein [Patescibacteria group bacterium]
MKKYLEVVRLSLQESLTYRFSFFLWRFRNLISFATIIIFWQAVYVTRQSLFGYQKSQMIAYLFGTAILRNLVLASKTTELAGQIKSGDLTKLLVRPMNIFSYMASRDMSDKLLNFVLSIFEVSLILFLFSFQLYFPQNPLTYLYFILILVLVVPLYFFISLIISLTGFWTEDIWATRWLFGVILLEFMAGIYFPIDILPHFLSSIFYLTPFPYLIYFPIKIWNEQLAGMDLIKTFIVCSGWLIIFHFLANKLWKKGVKNYGAYGG